MKPLGKGTDRGQSMLFPDCLQDWINENNPVQVIDVFVDELDLAELGFDGVVATVGLSRSIMLGSVWDKIGFVDLSKRRQELGATGALVWQLEDEAPKKESPRLDLGLSL